MSYAPIKERMYQTISNFNSSLPLSNCDVTINHTIESKEREDPEVTINNENISRSIPRHSNKKSSGSASKPKNSKVVKSTQKKGK